MEEKVQISQQILCKQMILERIGILVVLYKALSESYYSNQQNLKELSGLTSRIYEIFKCFISIQYNYVEMINCQQIPYLSKINKYTLIIDLDDTLVHYQELVDDGQFQSYVQQLLKEISKYYGIVIFTAAQQDYVDFILDLRDEDKVIGIRLYSQHTTLVNNTYGKDIQRIGRDIKRTRIIDNLADNFTFQPDNGIQIQSLYGDKDDQALLFLSPLLIQIVQKKIPDVRDALRKFRDQIKILIQIQVMIDQSKESKFLIYLQYCYINNIIIKKNEIKMKQKSIITFLKLINQQQFLFYNEQVKIIQINKLICECLTKIKQNKFFRKNKDL